MAKRVFINTSTALNGTGLIGAILFVVAPLVAGYCINTYLGNLGNAYRRGDQPGLLLFIWLSGIAWPVSIVMLLVGRDHRSEIVVEPETPAEEVGRQLWSQPDNPG